MIFEKNTSSFPARRNGNRYTQIFEYMFVLSKIDKPRIVNLICDKPNRWAGTINFGKNTHRTKNDNLVVTKDIKPVPDFSPRNNIWRYEVNRGYSTKDKEAHEHPAIFPEKLVYDHLLSWSKEEDIILDPFSGSGTTGKVSILNNRKFIGIELNKEFCNLSVKRINKHIEDENLKIKVLNEQEIFEISKKIEIDIKNKEIICKMIDKIFKNVLKKNK